MHSYVILLVYVLLYITYCAVVRTCSDNSIDRIHQFRSTCVPVDHLSLSPPHPTPPHRDHYYQYGEVRAVHTAAEQNCAFVTFSAREAAEAVRSGRGGDGEEGGKGGRRGGENREG